MLTNWTASSASWLVSAIPSAVVSGIPRRFLDHRAVHDRGSLIADAIERSDMEDLRGELGDLLFQVVFHARIAEEAGHFAFCDVVKTIADKMEAAIRISSVKKAA